MRTDWKNFEPNTFRNIESDSSKMLPICTNLKFQGLQEVSMPILKTRSDIKQALLFSLKIECRLWQIEKSCFAKLHLLERLKATFFAIVVVQKLLLKNWSILKSLTYLLSYQNWSNSVQLFLVIFYNRLKKG